MRTEISVTDVLTDFVSGAANNTANHWKQFKL